MVAEGESRNDRRGSERVKAFLAVDMSSSQKRNRFGVTRDASARGLLIVTQSRFAIGDILELAVHAPNLSEQVKARVVRIEKNPADSVEPWPFRLAVELDEALPSELLRKGEDIYRRSPQN